jgi:translation initiation factor IF-2
MAARRKQRKLSKKETKALKKVGDQPQVVESTRDTFRAAVDIELPQTITVSELAKLSGRNPGEIIGALMRNGVIASMNDSVDRVTVEILADELALRIRDVSEAAPSAESNQLVQAVRPPVVVVLGHVDHGKTTLLDSIRETQVAAKESGGITQHIGAYQVLWKDKTGNQRPITFLDTPGHEAFSALRAHGATMTDIAILVVAADDGVKPQTKEALSHARAANIPIIVALNKIDKPGANIEKVKAELAELGLQPEEWGGKTPVVSISAKNKIGIDDLLDTVLLIADLDELTARSVGLATGMVIESHKTNGIGPVATVLVQQGQLKIGDNIVIGSVYGKVRLLLDEFGTRHREVGPATPIQVAGLDDVPSFGANFEIIANEKQAREQARQFALKNRTDDRMNQSNLSVEEGQLALVVKADVDGSLKALKTALEAITVTGVQIVVIHAAVGQVTESDVHLAAASGAHIVAFHVGVLATARRLAENHGVLISAHDVIYELTDLVRLLAEGAVQKERIQVEIGQFIAKALFRVTKTHKIVGGVVSKGEIRKGATVTIERGSLVIGKGTISTLQRGQQQAPTVPQGEECGLGLDTTDQLQVDDVLRAFVEEERIVLKNDENGAAATVDNGDITP